jgi:hypothetical protein
VLEFYRVQLQYLLPHSSVLVAIFIHFYEMFVGVRSLILLFWLFHVQRWAGKGTKPIGTNYFQLRARAPIAYIASISLGK